MGQRARADGVGGFDSRKRRGGSIRAALPIFRSRTMEQPTEYTRLNGEPRDILYIAMSLLGRSWSYCDEAQYNIRMWSRSDKRAQCSEGQLLRDLDQLEYLSKTLSEKRTALGAMDELTEALPFAVECLTMAIDHHDRARGITEEWFGHAGGIGCPGDPEIQIWMLRSVVSLIGQVALAEIT